MVEEQQLAIDRLYNHNETLLIAGLGFGKAIVGLTAVDDLLTDGVLKRVLVLAPKQVADLTWATEPDVWDHLKHTVVIATGTEPQRLKAMRSGASIIVTNMENVGWMLKHFGATFDGLLVDEMSKLKAAGGATVKALRKWVTTLKWRAGMSGTPVAECAEDIYAQALLLDCGKALGTRKTLFLDTYFQKADYMGYSWAPRPGAIDAIAARLQNLVFTAADSAYKASLPGIDTHVFPFAFTDAERAVYRAMDKKSVWGEVIAPNAGVRQGKLQQIAAGGLYADDDRSLAWQSDLKQVALFSLMHNLEMDKAGPVIIVYTYLFEREWLTREYPDAPIIGGNSKISIAQLEAFNRGEIPVLLMHWRSGSHGLNLQGACSTMIHTTPLWGADGWSQTIGRIHRRGQTKRCTRYVLVTEGTVEEDMMQRVLGKATDESQFMSALVDAGAITAEKVKTLRELSGEGMMSCKSALVAHKGDVEGALEHLRCEGQAVVRGHGARQPCGCLHNSGVAS